MLSPLLLCLSTDAQLRETRRQVLLTRYPVTVVDSVAALKALPQGSAFDLLVLCHSLTERDREAAIQIARECWPHMKILSISLPYAGRVPGSADAIVGGLAGPLAMFESIAQLLPADDVAQL